MSKVMNSKQFINKLKEIASLPTTYYSVAGGNWAKWNGKSWNFDCVILIKAILWGWNGDKNASHGGAKYASNGVYDDGANQILKRCTDVSSDFTNITPGELLWMDGHVGVYIGNGQVIECTAAWEGKVLYSSIDSKGRRTRNGRQVYSWKKHGKLSYIEYVKEETPATTSKINVTYQTYDNQLKKYWSEITNYNNVNANGYAGCIGHSIGGIRVKASKGTITTQSHIKGGNWLSPVTKWDNTANGYSGIYGKDIDMVMIKSSVGTARYRVHIKGGNWLPWVSKYNINDSVNGMAGIYGKSIDAIQIEII